jgi:hypothetical protein
VAFWYNGGIRYCSWLSHYATRRKVAGSIPDEVIEIFNRPNPSSRTMALGSTQPLTKMNTRNLPKGRGRPARKADILTTIYEPIVYKMWEPRRLTTLWVSTTCYRDSFALFLFYAHNRNSPLLRNSAATPAHAQPLSRLLHSPWGT